MIAKVLLVIGYVICGVWAGGSLYGAGSPGEQTTGAVALLTGVICFVGVAVLDKLDELKKPAG